MRKKSNVGQFESLINEALKVSVANKRQQKLSGLKTSKKVSIANPLGRQLPFFFTLFTAPINSLLTLDQSALGQHDQCDDCDTNKQRERIKSLAHQND
jgi:hypothetical protein